MSWKKIAKALLMPPLALLPLLVAVATVCLVYTMTSLPSDSLACIAAYVLSAYTLTVVCVRVPHILRLVRKLRQQSKFARRWREDTRLRMSVSLYGSLLWNALYALFHLWLGLYHRTFWFYSLSAYYLSLAVMRFCLVRYTRRHGPGEQPMRELSIYRACGWVFLLMNLALSLIVFFMVYWNRTFIHHEITAIAMAAYTFTAFITATLGMVRYRRYKSPVYDAAKTVSFAAACVSMLTLTTTLLTAFGDGTMGATERRILLGAVGAAVSAAVVTLALWMIVKGTRSIKRHKAETTSKENKNGQQA